MSALNDVDKRQSGRKSALFSSATPTVVDDRSSRNDRDDESINEREGHDLFPGPDEQKSHPYLVEFGPMTRKIQKYVLLFFSFFFYSNFVSVPRTGQGCTDGI